MLFVWCRKYKINNRIHKMKVVGIEEKYRDSDDFKFHENAPSYDKTL